MHRAAQDQAFQPVYRGHCPEKRGVHPGPRHTQGGELEQITSNAEAGGRAHETSAERKSKSAEFLRLHTDRELVERLGLASPFGFRKPVWLPEQRPPGDVSGGDKGCRVSTLRGCQYTELWRQPVRMLGLHPQGKIRWSGGRQPSRGRLATVDLDTASLRTIGSEQKKPGKSRMWV